MHAEAHACGVRFQAAPGAEASLSGKLSVCGEASGWRLPITLSWRIEDGRLTLGDPSAGGLEAVGARCGGSIALSLMGIEASGRIEEMRILSGGRVVDFAKWMPMVRARAGIPWLASIMEGGVCDLEATMEAPGDWKVRIGRARPSGPEYMLRAENIPSKFIPWLPASLEGEKVSDGRFDLEAAFVRGEDGRWSIVKRLLAKGTAIETPGGMISAEGIEVEMSLPPPKIRSAGGGADPASALPFPSAR